MVALRSSSHFLLSSSFNFPKHVFLFVPFLFGALQNITSNQTILSISQATMPSKVPETPKGSSPKTAKVARSAVSKSTPIKAPKDASPSDRDIAFLLNCIKFSNDVSSLWEVN
jgi:hypothetical protein